MDAHQAEAVRAARTPIVVRPEPDVSIIVGFLFVIPAQRVAAGFRGGLVEEDPREVTSNGLDAAEAAPTPWFGITRRSLCPQQRTLTAPALRQRRPF
jgi:hypothetical protein